MYKEVCDPVKSCDYCQKINFICKYSSRLNLLFTGLFRTFSGELTGALPRTTSEIGSLFISVKHFKSCPLADPTSSITAPEVVAFIKQHFTYLFGRSCPIISNVGLCSTARSLEMFLNKYSIDWHSVMANTPMSSGWAERMVRTMKNAIGKVEHRKPSDRDIAVPRVLCRYKR